MLEYYRVDNARGSVPLGTFWAESELDGWPPQLVPLSGAIEELLHRYGEIRFPAGGEGLHQNRARKKQFFVNVVFSLP
jgi:hypothetical protein